MRMNYFQGIWLLKCKYSETEFVQNVWMNTSEFGNKWIIYIHSFTANITEFIKMPKTFKLSFKWFLQKLKA